MKELPETESSEAIEPRPAFRRLAGKMKTSLQHYQHREEKQSPEYWRGARLATKQWLLELQMILRRDWRAQ